MNFGNKPKSSDPTKLSVALRNKLSEEKEKFGETVKKQILGEQKPPSQDSVIGEIMTQGGKVSGDIDSKYSEKSAVQDKKRLSELEEELKKYLMDRQKKVSEYTQKVEGDFRSNEPPKEEVPFEMPHGIDRRSKMPGAGGKKKTKGSGEMIKQKK